METNEETPFLLLRQFERLFLDAHAKATLDEMRDPRVSRAHFVAELYDTMMISLHGYIWAEVLEAVEEEISYPSDWWQAFKQRWFPKALLRRWPVRMRVVHVKLERLATYPKFKPYGVEEPQVIKVRRLREEDETESDD